MADPRRPLRTLVALAKAGASIDDDDLDRFAFEVAAAHNYATRTEPDADNAIGIGDDDAIRATAETALGSEAAEPDAPEEPGQPADPIAAALARKLGGRRSLEAAIADKLRVPDPTDEEGTPE